MIRLYAHSLLGIIWILAAMWASMANADGPPRPIAADAFKTQIAPLLSKHCVGCHGETVQEGGVSYAALTSDEIALRKRPLWKRATQRVKNGEMPPDGEEPPSAADKQTLLEWMQFAGENLDCSEAARDPGPAPLRRLSRTQYDTTLSDLVGIRVRSGETVGMPEDGVVDGFENTASALSLSPALMEKYLAAADYVLEQLYLPQHARHKESLFVAQPSAELTQAQAAERILRRFAERAYRGKVDATDLDPLLAIYDRARQRGLKHDDAIKAALKPVLVAPRFLYRVEEPRATAANGIAGQIDDFALAARLSYFLWSSMPDEELAQLAVEDKLSQSEGLRAQVLRMLANPKAAALEEHFAVQWLQLKKLDHARPTTEFFPTFTHSLRSAMKAETLQFLKALRERDGSLLELLDSDYTFANEELAKHYQLPAITGNDLQRVPVTAASHRGGLLGMASVLTLTSHTFRTSPTQRGKYILEVVFGTPPPPPPPNVSVLKDDEQNKRRAPTTFREQLAQHATQKSCAGCHKQLDPLGFALDNYDAIGAWRESRPEFPLDTSGELPTGEQFNGAAELKALIVQRKDDFARNVAGKMLSYALGRELDYYDDCALAEIMHRLQQNNYRYSELVLGIAESYPMLYRRTEQ